MLNAEMTTLIKQNTIGCVATVTTDGRPAVSPKGTFIVVDDTTIAFSHIRSRNTVNNIRRARAPWRSISLTYSVARHVGCVAGQRTHR